MNARHLILYLAVKFNGNWENILNFIKNKEPVDVDEVEKLANDFKGEYITLVDEEYPKNLQASRRPPFILFYKGDISILSLREKNFLSVIGSRNCSDYAKNTISKIINELPNDIIIVSGMAKGIDGVAHLSALNSKKKTIAILGSGIDYIYPSENKYLYERIIKEGGLILSEYPLNSEPEPNNFLFRNRLIACLCNSLLVGESYGRSGSKSTVTYAVEEGKDIGCLPFPANENSNCNQYIKEGCFLIENKDDVLLMMDKWKIF